MVTGGWTKGDAMGDGIETALDRIYREEWGRVLAVTMRRTRDMDLAEDIAQEAFARAWATWPRDGLPPSPSGWLMMTARNLWLDGARRQQVLARKLPLLVVEPDDGALASDDEDVFGDERLRLLFTCCHPALAMPARVALSLRLVCGLSTEVIARLFLVQSATMAARLTRAKRKIQAAGIPYRVPDRAEMDSRLQGVLAVVYLVYTEGHTAGEGDRLRRDDLVRLASDLVELLRGLLPDDPEVMGLAALIRLTEARQGARFGAAGGVVLLEEMDRSQWDQAAIATGLDLVERALRRTDRRQPGVYALQAAIAALHAEAGSYDATDWVQVAAFYRLAMQVQPSPVLRLGWALAVGMADGPAAGLGMLDALEREGSLAGYGLLYAARADVLRRAGQCAAAAAAYREAARLSANEVMARDFLERAGRLEAGG